MERTVDQLLQQIHREYEGDTDYLEFEDEETQLRVEYLKDSIREWVGRFPEYREAFSDLSSASDGDKVTQSGVQVYSCPSNFIRHANFIEIGSSIFTYVSPDQLKIKLNENPSGQYFTVIGYPGAYQIKINYASGGGEAINYDYWKKVTSPSYTTDKVQISRPVFCVHYTLWKIYKEDDPDQEEKYKKLMEEDERLERVELAKTPSGPNRIFVSGAGFGDTSRTNL